MEPHTWWDYFKRKIKGKLIEIGIKTKREENNQLEDLQNRLKQKENDNTTEMRDILKIKQDIKKIQTDKLNGYLLRAKIDQQKYMDKPSKYFYALEKARNKSKNIIELINNKGEVVNSKPKILDTIENFYQDLYGMGKTDEHEKQNIYNALECLKLKENATTLGDLVDEPELRNALNQMSNNKSPGSDGLTKEFYTVFWEDLKEELIETINNIYLRGEMTDSQKMAIVKLIYKKGNPKELKNWRPISLLNIDYKLLSKIMANRLKKVMSKITGKDQYCGIPKKSIHTANSILTNIWDIENTYSRSKLMFLLIDQKKAFDRVDHQYLFGTLKALNLPENFIHWVQCMYKNVYSQIEINGTLTKKINIKRSVRQGCPLSMLLFVLSAEGLAEMIRQNQSIKGYKITPSSEKKIVAYADDTTLLLTDKVSIQQSLETIERYCNASGAMINKEKTEVLITGPWKIRDIREVLAWAKDEATILGITYSKNNMGQKIFSNIIKEIKGKMEIWGKRAHNIVGRSHLLNIYALPKILYRLRHIDMPNDLHKTLNREIFNFVWNQPIQPIQQSKIAKPRHLGGTGLIDLHTRQKAMWQQEAYEMVEFPNLEENLLRRARLGPIPNLSKTWREKNQAIKHVNMTEIKSARTKYLRLFLKDHIPSKQKLKDIYNNIMEETQPISEETRTQFRLLNRIEDPKQWQYGYHTLHEGHITRYWLYSRGFSSKDIMKSKGQCTNCQKGHPRTLLRGMQTHKTTKRQTKTRTQHRHLL